MLTTIKLPQLPNQLKEMYKYTRKEKYEEYLDTTIIYWRNKPYYSAEDIRKIMSDLLVKKPKDRTDHDMNCATNASEVADEFAVMGCTCGFEAPKKPKEPKQECQCCGKTNLLCLGGMDGKHCRHCPQKGKDKDIDNCKICFNDMRGMNYCPSCLTRRPITK